jgi:hypothetical protein
MSDFRPQIKKNALSNSKIRLVAANNVGKQASMSFKLKKNNPQVQVYTNEPNDQENYGRIDAALDTPTFNAYLEMLRAAATDPDFKKEIISNKNYIFPNGRRSDAPVHVSDLMVGREEDGTIWTAITAKGRPMIKFLFITPDFHAIIGADREPLPRGQASKYVTLGFVNMLSNIMNMLQVTEYEEPVQKQQGGGGDYRNNGASGNRNNGSSSGGNYSNKSSSDSDSFGDDVPF